MDTGPDVTTEDNTPEDENPRGTFFLVIVFLVMIVVLWFWTYGVLLDRA